MSTLLEEIKKVRKAKKRYSFAKLPALLKVPNLLDIQLDSYKKHIQFSTDYIPKDNFGLEEIFQNFFPVEEPKGNIKLDYLGYTFDNPKYSIDECKERNMTYSAPLRIKLRLTLFEDVDSEGTKKVKELIEQDVYLGDLPLITDTGTFVINGAERVIVSQLHRSPGVTFDSSVHPNGKVIYTAKIVPYHGSWIEFTTDVNNVVYVHIDKRRKLPVTSFLRAIGYSSDDDIRKLFYNKLELPVDENLINQILAEDIFSKETGEVLLEKNVTIDGEALETLRNIKLQKVSIFSEEDAIEREYIENTLAKDPTKNEEDALKKIYNLLRPGNIPVIETAKKFIEKLFFNPQRYNLKKVGRYRLNQKLRLRTPIDVTVLTHEDLIAIIKYIMALKKGKGYIDDIDHLGNRRVRTVGELLITEFSAGLSRMTKLIRERMNIFDVEKLTPYELVNARTVSNTIFSFFATGQLSQFMDQTNPLSEITHKRKFSALGPGGLKRERAGFEVRDVHFTHYGRICPIETPEGQNIGLILSPATYATINDFGFIETPLRKVEDGKVTEEIVYMSSEEEEDFVISQASTPLDKDGTITEEFLIARKRDEYPVVHRTEVQYMDVSPQQITSLSASLIPFLEHDDANRALMGSNMQRQAVPLLNPESPAVGTGLEYLVAVDSGAVITAKRAGIATKVTSKEIIIEVEHPELTIKEHDKYKLKKFLKSNQSTCINQHPIIKQGDRIEKGQVITDGPAVQRDELALGLNVFVAFLPFYGYNFEDAVIISERMVKNDRFTSIHIEELEVQVRDIKHGKEELTRELPNVSEEARRNLDEEGIIRVGSWIKDNDILVGKITPKGEVEPSPEEKLLKAIFGEKAGDVSDTSLRVPPGIQGVVYDVKVFARREEEFESEAETAKIKKQLRKLEKEKKVRLDEIIKIRNEKVSYLLNDCKAKAMIDVTTEKILIKEGQKLTDKILKTVNYDHLDYSKELTDNETTNGKVKTIYDDAQQDLILAEIDYKKKMERLKHGDELPPGIRKLIKVYIAQKRKISVGDKVSGRHGNKGVVSKIVPEEDMPYLANGKRVDVILNPLGVPSRMNIGQILETHLGWAAEKLGIKTATPVFDGASIEDIYQFMKLAEIPETGKVDLYDGRNGDKLDQQVTVGINYVLKLSHLVEDKMHARSTGPYSLVTQQPLGGKAQFGGQRIGEMEVWAFEAYGAAYTLQELMTVKSDDVEGRNKTYQAIVKRRNLPEAGVPASFNVLINELRSLALNVELKKENEIENL